MVAALRCCSARLHGGTSAAVTPTKERSAKNPARFTENESSGAKTVDPFVIGELNERRHRERDIEGVF
jgi:hypothetical protein